jgi:hypothetical protein
MCLNSTTRSHSSRWSLRSSVSRIVLSSQQVKENHPTTSLACPSSPAGPCNGRTINFTIAACAVTRRFLVYLIVEALFVVLHGVVLASLEPSFASSSLVGNVRISARASSTHSGEGGSASRHAACSFAFAHKTPYWSTLFSGLLYSGHGIASPLRHTDTREIAGHRGRRRMTTIRASAKGCPPRGAAGGRSRGRS